MKDAQTAFKTIQGTTPDAPVMDGQEASGIYRKRSGQAGGGSVTGKYADLLAKYFSSNADKMSRVMMAESGGRTSAYNANKNGTADYGLFQINSSHLAELQKAGIIQSLQDLYDPNANAQAAAYLYKQSGYSPWSSSEHQRGGHGWGDVQITNNTTINAPNADGKEVAREVKRILDRQVSRNLQSVQGTQG